MDAAAGVKVTRYGPDEFAVRMNANTFAMLVAVVGKMSASGDGIYGQHGYKVLKDEIVKDSELRELMEEYRKQTKSYPHILKFRKPEGEGANEFEGTKLWNDILRLVPDNKEKLAEVLESLRIVKRNLEADDSIGPNTGKALGSAFTWASTVQGHEYWSAIAKGEFQ